MAATVTGPPLRSATRGYLSGAHTTACQSQPVAEARRQKKCPVTRGRITGQPFPALGVPESPSRE
jgi:hypothetical protein